jgi:SAM-dependent methyltransferase
LVPERGSLLDIGCGFGFFLDAAAQRGWRPFGADVSEVGVAHAREGLGLADVHRGAFGDGVFGDTSFDAVTLWNVLEHVQDPRSLIDVVASRLASNGAIAIRVPNSTAQRRRIELGRAVPSAVAAKVSGLVDVSVLAGAPPHHLHGFTPKSLTQALSERGFSDIQIRPSIVSDFAATAAQRGAVSALTGLISTLERFGPGGWAVGVSPSMTATARWEGAS